MTWHHRWLNGQRAIVALLTFGSCIAQTQPVQTNPLDQKAKPFLERYNSKLPTMVAPTLRQEKSSVFNGSMTFTYTVINKTADQVAAMNLAVTQRPYIFPSICTAPDTGRMLREGYTFRYLYFGNDGKPAAHIVVLPTDCARSG